MSLCINPKETKIRVAVNGGFVILIVASASVDQSRRIRKASGTAEMRRNKLEWKDDSNEVILQVVDEILIDVGAMDVNENQIDLTYTDDLGEEKPLGNTVENWKDKISENIKLAAGREFFSVNAEIGEELIKN